MKFFSFLIIFLLNAFYCICLEDEILDDSNLPIENELARGFGNDIKWVSFEQALKKAQEHTKPIFLLIHKTWCGACNNLKSHLSKSLKFKELSESFLMVNLEDDEEPSDKAYAPDGSYIPRLLFLNHLGQVESDFINEIGNPKYKYYYSSAESVINTMEQVKESHLEQNKKSTDSFFSFDDDEEEYEPGRFDYLNSHSSSNIEVDFDEMNILDDDQDLDFLDEYHQEL